MFVITVFRKNCEQGVFLRYKDFQGAKRVSDMIQEALSKPPLFGITDQSGPPVQLPLTGALTLSDDFGCMCVATVGSIDSVVLTDIRLEQDAMNEHKMVAARAQADLMTKINSDPKLKVANAMANGGGGFRIPQ